MIGILLWKEPQRGLRQKPVTLSERNILHMRFLCAEITRGLRTPEAALGWRVSSAARRMRKMGVTRAVLPEGFAYGAQLEKQGLRPVSTLSLRRRLAADWVRQALAEGGVSPGGARVAVSAAQMTGELVRTVTELSLRHRYVLLDVPYGAEELCRRLRREYGVSLLLGADREQLEGADALVLFDPRTDLRRRGGVTLPLYDEAAPMRGLSLPPALEERLPEGAGRGQLLSALLEAGVLRPGQVSASVSPGSAAGNTVLNA
ncbi:MAG: hypothetical protein HFG12_08015 [Oscillibacter sp.]|jgi:hypothetical protein|nr:hypothetical protein [uncultured Oscillibacter sp.]MCI8813164.1 hypothetical protein [Oscillibacter sp.]